MIINKIDESFKYETYIFKNCFAINVYCIHCNALIEKDIIIDKMEHDTISTIKNEMITLYQHTCKE